MLIRFSVIIRRISALRTGSAQALAVTWTPFVSGYATGTTTAMTARLPASSVAAISTGAAGG